MFWGNRIAVACLAAIIGIPSAFFTIALPAQMRDGGATLFEIGFIYIIWLPAAFKWLWAPWLEKIAQVPKLRARAILLFAIALALSFLPVAGLAESNNVIALILLAPICAAFSLSMQLIYAGWAIQWLDFDQRAQLNGILAAGMIAGGLVGGGVLVWLAHQFGWWLIIIVISCLIVLIGSSGYLLKSGEKQVTEKRQPKSFREGLSLILKAPLIGAIALLALSGGADVTLPARLVDVGVAPDQAALLLGSLVMILMIPASLLSGWSVGRFGLARCLIICVISKAVILAALAISPASATLLIIILSMAEFVFAGALTVLTWQFYMGQSQGIMPVALYAIVTSIDAFLRFFGAMGAGAIAEIFGYTPLYGLAAFLTCAAGFSVLYILTSSSDVQNSANLPSY